MPFSVGPGHVECLKCERAPVPLVFIRPSQCMVSISVNESCRTSPVSCVLHVGRDVASAIRTHPYLTPANVPSALTTEPGSETADAFSSFFPIVSSNMRGSILRNLSIGQAVLQIELQQGQGFAPADGAAREYGDVVFRHEVTGFNKLY